MPGSHNKSLLARLPEASGEFTFCSWLWLFVGMLVAELGVLLSALAPGRTLDLWNLGVTSLYAQWINVLALATLCVSESWLKRLPRRVAWMCAWLLVVIAAAFVSGVVGWLDHALGWGLTDYRWPAGHLLLRTVCMTALLAGGVLRYQAVHRRWQEGLRAQERARFQALQARIHPHFLFNSLNSIAALTIDQPPQAERAIENLSDLLRGTLRDPEQAISLRDELSLCRSYLEIEALRLGTRLQVEWQTADLPMEMRVPPLLLQPLVENAIVHGIQRRPEGGLIRIHGEIEENHALIMVENPLATSSQITHQSGIALDNLRGRLDLRYAGAARLETGIEQGMYIARLRLPLGESTRAGDRR